ncbi:hypothetical protein CFV354_0117 [Campylobacter fetus subsp. venerealis NCTC 10354]|nr:hypothetical protein CFV354_0117 [Campylobacter fetus subsp. venerealis NCTC 10354]
MSKSERTLVFGSLVRIYSYAKRTSK